jgi:lipopolysaccharide/colanic/teichoic acid biosynthesis glycosyltransferase
VSRIFLGKWWHWGILIASVAALWVAGDKRMHVIHFNAFVLSLLVATAMVIAILIVKTRPGEQITRDRLEAGAEQLRTDGE